MRGCRVTGIPGAAVAVFRILDELGPPAGASPTVTVISTARADDDSEDEEAEGYREEIHEVSSNLMLLPVFLHIGGVIISSRLHNEPLVRAMVTGNKARRPE